MAIKVLVEEFASVGVHGLGRAAWFGDGHAQAVRRNLWLVLGDLRQHALAIRYLVWDSHLRSNGGDMFVLLLSIAAIPKTNIVDAALITHDGSSPLLS